MNTTHPMCTISRPRMIWIGNGHIMWHIMQAGFIWIRCIPCGLMRIYIWADTQWNDVDQASLMMGH